MIERNHNVIDNLSSYLKLLILILSLLASFVLSMNGRCDDINYKKIDKIINNSFANQQLQACMHNTICDIYEYGLKQHQDQKALYDRLFILSLHELLSNLAQDISIEERGTTFDEAKLNNISQQVKHDLKPYLDQPLLDDQELARQRLYSNNYFSECRNYLFDTLCKSQYIILQNYPKDVLDKIMEGQVSDDLALGGFIITPKFNYKDEIIRLENSGIVTSFALIELNSFVDIFSHEMDSAQNRLFAKHYLIKDEKEYAERVKSACTIIDLSYCDGAFVIDQERTPVLLAMLCQENLRSTVNINKNALFPILDDKYRIENALLTKKTFNDDTRTVYKKNDISISEQIEGIIDSCIPEELRKTYSVACHELYAYGLSFHKDSPDLYNKRFLYSVESILSPIKSHFQEMKKMQPDFKFSADFLDQISSSMLKELKPKLEKSPLLNDEDIDKEFKLLSIYFDNSHANLISSIRDCRYIAFQNYPEDKLKLLDTRLSVCKKIILNDFIGFKRRTHNEMTSYHLFYTDSIYYDNDYYQMTIANNIQSGSFTGYLVSEANMYLTMHHKEKNAAIGNLFYPATEKLNEITTQSKIQVAQRSIGQSVKRNDYGNVFIVDKIDTNEQINNISILNLEKSISLKIGNFPFLENRTWVCNAIFKDSLISEDFDQ